MKLPENWSTALAHLAFGGGAGAAITVVLVLAEKEPRLLIQAVTGFGPWWLMGFLVIALMYQGGGKLLQVARDNASSQQSLADAVNRIATKDDERNREMELVVNYLARNSKQALDELGQLSRDVNDLRTRLAPAEMRADAHTAG